MNTKTKNTFGHQARRKKYIDSNIQGRLIFGLLLLEIALFSFAMWFVYQELQMAIDNSLYRVHKPDAANSPILMNALLTTIPWIIFVNVLLLVGLDLLWGKYLAIILEPLRKIIDLLKSLDLRSHRDVVTEHVVLEYAQHWMHQERQLCKEIRQLVQQLPEQMANLKPDEQQSISETLSKVNQHLP